MALSSESNTLLSLDELHNINAANIAIVSTEWNDKIVAAQISGALDVLNKIGGINVTQYVVPGAFEIPFACKQIAEKTKGIVGAPDAIIAFGAVIRGGTPHFEYVCEALVQGVSALNISLPIPTIFGVLTLNTEAEAWERLGGVHGHKGEEAAIAALKMIQFNRAISI
ncbi:MAG: 6,7-dimethyl-8-ribityllumazine synthase [Chitinophagaceae bacterium]|nr:6,7-dimethyl-8-ribityllumazine synthase [Chitinophagaceae bacterium]